MSYTYLLESGEEFSAECFSGISQFVPSRLTSIAGKCSSKGNETESCQDSQSGTTSAPSTGHRGEESPASCAEDSLARTSARQEKEPASTGKRAGYGMKCGELLAMYDLSSSSWKTPHSLFSEDLHWCSVTLPRWGMMQGGLCWELTPADIRITAPAFGWWPTPSGVNGGTNHVMGRLDEWGGSSNPWRQTPTGKCSSPEFEKTVMGFPTGWTALTALGTLRFQQWRQRLFQSYLE